jgi:putative Ca2+/H+ antiporter (TMEM165/GDT1 family)
MDAVTSSAVPPAAPKDGAVMTDLMALYQSFFMILASEVGDKTFLIAAILSMRHSRLTVFLGSFSSLVVMSALSAGMGQLLPSLFLPPKWTHLGASILFLSFGVKMGKEGYEMEAGNAKVQEEMKEVEQEIEEGEEEHEPIPMRDIETGAPESSKLTDNPEGHVALDPEGTPSKPRRELKSRVKEGAHNFASLFLGPVFVQAFILTFLGEWGDRSQIATIALAAAHVSFVYFATATHLVSLLTLL